MSTAGLAASSETAPAFRLIDHPAAWRADQIGGGEGLFHRLSPEQIDAMKRLANAISDRELADIRRDDVSDPALTALMQAVKFELMRGKGAIVLSGLGVDGLTESQFQKLFWALGTHLGRGVVQSSKRDLVGRVEVRADNPEQRGYQLDIELGSHCDFHEILALGCYRVADAGGESGMVSSLAVHNVLAQTRPDLLAALYRGFPHQHATPEDRSAHNVPVFCDVDGTVSGYYHRLFYVNAARDMGVKLPDDLAEAMTLFDQLCRGEDLRASFLMQPGEMVFWHNFTVLHARNSFSDRPEHRRLLFRLWLHAYEGEGRPMAPDFTARARMMDREHEAGRPGIVYRLDGLR